MIANEAILKYLGKLLENILQDFEVRHPRCVGSITKNIVYFMYSRTQIYFS